MKILHVVPSYFPAHHWGGPIASVHILNRWLAKKGVEVTVYTTDLDIPREGAVRGAETDVDGVKVWYFPVHWKAWRYSRGLHLALSKNIKNFDLIHITSTFLSASALGSYYARKWHKPYIISPRGNLMRGPLEKGAMKSFKKAIYLHFVERKNLAGASAVHFTVEMEKEEYFQADLPAQRSIVIPNGLEFGRAREDRKPSFPSRKKFKKKFGVPEAAKIVLALGRIAWIKGFDTLIPAFAAVLRRVPDTVLVVAGPDDEGYRKTVEGMVTMAGIRKKAIFTGMLTGNDKTEALHASSVLVLPSYSESFGMAVAEAMNESVPVVVSKHVGIAASVENAQAGFVVEKEEKQLTEAIVRVLGDELLARRMGNNGRLLVEKEFSASLIAEKWVGVYDRFI